MECCYSQYWNGNNDQRPVNSKPLTTCSALCTLGEKRGKNVCRDLSTKILQIKSAEAWQKHFSFSFVLNDLFSNQWFSVRHRHFVQHFWSPTWIVKTRQSQYCSVLLQYNARPVRAAVVSNRRQISGCVVRVRFVKVPAPHYRISARVWPQLYLMEGFLWTSILDEFFPASHNFRTVCRGHCHAALAGHVDIGAPRHVPQWSQASVHSSEEPAVISVMPVHVQPCGGVFPIKSLWR